MEPEDLFLAVVDLYMEYPECGEALIFEDPQGTDNVLSTADAILKALNNGEVLALENDKFVQCVKAKYGVTTNEVLRRAKAKVGVV
jgi:hypothetical protein